MPRKWMFITILSILIAIVVALNSLIFSAVFSPGSYAKKQLQQLTLDLRKGYLKVHEYSIQRRIAHKYNTQVLLPNHRKTPLPIRYGYPTGNIRNINDLAMWVEIDISKWQLQSITEQSFALSLRGVAEFNIAQPASQCHLVYQQPKVRKRQPILTVYDTGC